MSAELTPARARPRPPLHMPGLDGVRGLAILLVVPHNTAVGTEGLARVFTLAASAGWVGVQLFFVLSGFLITLRLLDALGSATYYRTFYARRILRIFPLYYATLTLLFIVLPAIGLPVVTDSQHQIWSWVYLSNWTDPMGLNVPGLGHFWSLAVEEQFYLTWPLLVAVGSRRLLHVCLAVAGAAVLFRLVLLWQGASPYAIYLWTFCRMDALALGAAAAAYFRRADFALPPPLPGRLFWLSMAMIVAGAVPTALYRSREFANLSFGFTLLAVAFAMFVLAVATPGGEWWRRALQARWLRLVGKYSYAMYVFHLPLDLVLRDSFFDRLAWAGSWRPVAYMAVMTLLSYGAAFLSYHALEKHFLRLKRYFEPRDETMPRSRKPAVVDQ